MKIINQLSLYKFKKYNYDFDLHNNKKIINLMQLLYRSQKMQVSSVFLLISYSVY